MADDKSKETNDEALDKLDDQGASGPQVAETNQVTQISQQTPTNQLIGDKADPKSRLAMMAFAFFAAPTGIARAYIGETSGVVRLWIYIGTAFLMMIPLVQLVAFLPLLVLSIWGLVDFFLLRGKRVDSLNQPLYSTNRDERIIRYLYIAFIVLISIVAVTMIIALAAIIFAGIASNSSSTPINSFSL